jgi:hypothetical protein
MLDILIILHSSLKTKSTDNLVLMVVKETLHIVYIHTPHTITFLLAFLFDFCHNPIHE